MFDFFTGQLILFIKRFFLFEEAAGLLEGKADGK
jgi:hypothetical protein